MAQSAVLTVAEAQQSAVKHAHYVYIGSRYMLSMHSIHICGVCMYAYAPFCDQETFELRMYLLYTYIYVICCMPRLPAPAAVVSIYTQLSWAIGPAGPVCVCVPVCVCYIDPYAEETRPWSGTNSTMDTNLSSCCPLFCVYAEELPGSNNAEKPDRHTRTHTHIDLRTGCLACSGWRSNCTHPVRCAAE